MRINITKIPVNQADKNAAYIIVKKIITEDGTIKGGLYDKDDNLIAKNRVYSYSGGYKNIPFTDLVNGDIAYMDGADPDETWKADTIKLWLDDRQIIDEEKGMVSESGQFYYNPDATKEDLLAIVENSNNNKI